MIKEHSWISTKRQRILLALRFMELCQPLLPTTPYRPVFLTSILLLGSVAPALAWSMCAMTYPQPMPVLASEWELELAQLQEQFSDCLDSSGYFALLGAANLNTGRTMQALEALERALLLDPNNGAAQIDYAQALYLVGDRASALHLNRQLLQREDLPQYLRPILAQRGDDWMRSERQHLSRVGLRVGYDSNLNGAADLKTLILTIPEGNLSLILDEDSRSVGGPFSTLQLRDQWGWVGDGWQGQWYMDVSSRASEYGPSDYTLIDTAYRHQIDAESLNWFGEVGAGHLYYDGTPYLSTFEGKLGAERAIVPFQVSSWVQWQTQQFHEEERLNGDELRLAVRLLWPAGELGEWRWDAAAIANLAQDARRPGGDREGWETAITWSVPYKGGAFSASAQLSLLQDQDSYSSLLESGEVREITRQELYLQYTRPVGRHLLWSIGAQYQIQHSTLKLFEHRDVSVDTGLHWLF